MVELGYALSCEEHPPNDLVDYARRAEETGFSFALISDHFHPWIDKQGHSPFVWTVLSAIARETSTLQVGTGATCPTVRIHPANIAQAATVATMMPGRFFLGVGTGENLNEHIVGERWSSANNGVPCSRKPSRSSASSGKAGCRATMACAIALSTPGSTRCRRSRSS